MKYAPTGNPQKLVCMNISDSTICSYTVYCSIFFNLTLLIPGYAEIVCVW